MNKVLVLLSLNMSSTNNYQETVDNILAQYGYVISNIILTNTKKGIPKTEKERGALINTMAPDIRALSQEYVTYLSSEHDKIVEDTSKHIKEKICVVSNSKGSNELVVREIDYKGLTYYVSDYDIVYGNDGSKVPLGIISDGEFYLHGLAIA